MKNSNKILTALFLVVICVVLVLLIGSLVLSKVIKNKIQQEGNKGDFKIELEELNVNLLTRNASIKNISVDDLIRGHKIRIKAIDIHRFHLLKALINKTYKVKSILIQNPQVTLLSNKTDSTEAGPTFENSGKMPKINVAELEIENAELSVFKKDTISSDTIFETRFNLEINSISSYDSTLQFTSKWGNFEHLKLQIANTFYRFPNHLYHLETADIVYDSRERKINIDSLALKSEYSKYEIAHQTGVETDWLDLSVNTLIFNELDLYKLLTNNTFTVSSITIPELSIVVFRDKRLPFPQKPDTKLPSEMIADLPFGIHIDSLQIEDGNVEYEEQRKTSDKTGSITFNNLNATIYTISNREDMIKTETKIEVSANVLDDALLSANFYFPNKKYPITYRATGHLQPMQMAPFNSIFRSSASAEITSGRINQFAFDFEYNNNKSNGNLKFQYENLKVTLLDPKENDEKKVNSLLLNTFVIRDENPDNKKNMREGKIDFERDKKRAIFNYWWKSLLSGIKDVVTG